MLFAEYLDEIRTLHRTGQTTEHSFRPALARLFQAIDPTLEVINEPKRLTDVGAPDFVFNRDGVAIGWCEAKDLDKDVTTFKTGDYSREQKERYKRGLPNLIYTNGVDFEFLRDGEKAGFVSIADYAPGLPARPDRFEVLEAHLKDFVTQTPVSITSAKQLAKMMAGKAVLIKDIMGRALVADLASGKPTELTDQYEGFKASLIHDISVEDFADIYAETLAYGLFAARLHDTTLTTFTRAEALELLPKSNPFLRNLFVYIAGPNLDDRLVGRIDELCQIFLATDLADLMKDFGKFTARNDPFLHFYETFLAEYNPAKRKARGVWYTPEPVVNFIVRAVDDVLKSEFGLADGLADTSKISIDWDTGQNDPKTGKPVTIKKGVHRVQILDPATGTGTFLAEVIKLVAGRVKGIAPGQWSDYVERDLIPRLHGFELLMASYAMCHMKLDMMLTELGYKPTGTPPRLSVYLTNSLEEGDRVEQTLPFARWVSDEAKGANAIKRDHPIMCVIGNPPYSGESANKGPWIMGLMEAYKMEPGGKERLKERNSKWLNDDYVKFIRMSEELIAKNPAGGVMGFITNHGYLDNPTFRGMRWRLLKTFDKIWVIDLHGNSKKKEVSPDGSSDKNVFDIQQGVALIVAVRKGLGSGDLADVWHRDLWGGRSSKYEALWSSSLSSQMAKVKHIDPYYFLEPFGGGAGLNWSAGFSLAEFFKNHCAGVVTANDEVLIGFDEDDLETRIKNNFSEFNKKICVKQIYRPLDVRALYFDLKKIARPREVVSRQFISPNIGLSFMRPSGTFVDLAFGVTESIVDQCATANKSAGGGISYQAPLYTYRPVDPKQTEAFHSNYRSLNFDIPIFSRICMSAGLPGPIVGPNGTNAFRTATGDARPDEVKVFDYIYGVLHSPAYRETYREFLKIDFPRVPYPRDPETFRHVSGKGEALRRLHLMEDAAIGETPFPFHGEGDSVVGKPEFAQGRVWINPEQYFDNVPDLAWTFPIGGYQPAQKWLKDRKGRALSFDDIRHYQKVIKILTETDRIMKEIALPLD